MVYDGRVRLGVCVAVQLCTPLSPLLGFYHPLQLPDSDLFLHSDWVTVAASPASHVCLTTPPPSLNCPPGHHADQDQARHRGPPQGGL